MRSRRVTFRDSKSPVTPRVRRSSRLSQSHAESSALAARVADVSISSPTTPTTTQTKGKGKRRARELSSPAGSPETPTPLPSKRTRVGKESSSSLNRRRESVRPHQPDDAGDGLDDRPLDVDMFDEGGYDPPPPNSPQAGPSGLRDHDAQDNQPFRPPPTPPPPPPPPNTTSSATPDHRWVEFFTLTQFIRRETQTPMRTYFLSRARSLATELGVDFDVLTQGEFEGAVPPS